MKIVAHLLPQGAASNMSSVTRTVEINCGSGEQILRWLGVTACLRMAYDLDFLMGQYVPQVRLGPELSGTQWARTHRIRLGISMIFPHQNSSPAEWALAHLSHPESSVSTQAKVSLRPPDRPRILMRLIIIVTRNNLSK